MALKAAPTVVAVVAAVAVVVAVARRPGRRTVMIVDPNGPQVLDATGTASSVQAAELRLTPAQVRRLFSPAGLERLAGGYWRFLRRISLGLIQVRETAFGPRIVVLGRPPVLLAFGPPEYVLDGCRGTVRWPIRGGLLVAPGRRATGGSLEIGLRRSGGDATDDDCPSPVRVEIRVAGFAPSIAAVFGTRCYEATQSRIHVLVTNAFLRSLGGFTTTTSGTRGGSSSC